MSDTRYFCQLLMKFEFSPQSFKKFSGIKFLENPSNEPSCSTRTQRNDEKNSHCSNVVNTYENLKRGENFNHSRVWKTLCVYVDSMLTVCPYPPVCLKYNKFFVSLDLIIFL